MTPEVSATQHLGDLGPGQAMSVTWSITATADSPPSAFTWPAVITAAAGNAPPVSAGDEIQVRKTWDSGYRLDRDGYYSPNDTGDPLDWEAFDKAYYLEDAATRFHYYTSPWYGGVYDWWIGADPRNPGAGLCVAASRPRMGRCLAGLRT
ncbi:MAG TPA: hypothetical protein EYP49_05705 [Anaerolineae bacterium]|nr:hypothetical protein [Anaerolineae bacterium]